MFFVLLDGKHVLEFLMKFFFPSFRINFLRRFAYVFKIQHKTEWENNKSRCTCKAQLIINLCTERFFVL